MQKYRQKFQVSKIYYNFLSRDDLKMLLGYHSKEKSMSAIEECLFHYECSKYVQR